jgi:adenylate cyclase
MIRITYSFQGSEKVFERETAQVVIGRHKDGLALDLAPDMRVSRLHARVWIEDGQLWIEDLNTTRGTKVNGEEIKGQGRRPVRPDDQILIGETILKAESPPVEATDTPAESDESETFQPPVVSLDATDFAFAPTQYVNADLEQRLALLYELPLQLGAETRLESLLQLVVERVVSVIPSAKRGALLVKDRATERLTLKAHLPPGNPAVSRTMADEAMEQRKAFIWSPQDRTDPDLDGSLESVVRHHIESAMYAPLMWNDEALGVLCVDNSEVSPPFQSDDLRLLQAVAHHAAMAVAHHTTREDLRRHAEFTNRFFSSRFPPSVRDKLMSEANAGTLPIGTRRSQVTILISDIRGFTQMTSRLGAQRMSDLLNEVFPPLINAIFSQGGTIERFVGDAIFAVFGSPEPDDNQHEHAVRAALEMQQVIKDLRETSDAQGAETCAIGIGIDCGEALHGFIGNAERMEYTVLGDVANRASRYCAGAGEGEILISPDAHQWVWNIIMAEQTSIATKHEGNFTAYRITGG